MSSVIPSPIGPATTAKRGTMSAADKTKLDAITGTNTGDVTLPSTVTGWLSLAGQALTFALVSASQTVAGVVDLAAQTFAGVKTFVAEAVFSAGILSTGVRAASASLLLRSDLGAGASDKCVTSGSSDTAANLNAAAKLHSWGTGIGGTYVEAAYLSKGGAFLTTGAPNGTNLSSGVGAAIGSYNVNIGSAAVWLGTAVPTTLNYTLAHSDSGGLGTPAGVSVNAPTGSLINLCFAGVAKAKVTSLGEFESLITGSGIVLKSPDGTRYRLTVANGGTLVIAAA